MIEFNTDNTNWLVVIANFVLSMVSWVLWALWVFGIRFGKEKKALQAQREVAFREEQDEKWREYRRNNTHLVTKTYETKDEYGNVLSRESFSWIEDPGKRSIFFSIALVIVGIILAFGLQKIIGINPYLGGGVLLLLGYGVWKGFKSYLIYDRWYMRLVYSIVCYALVASSIAHIADNILGGNKL